MNFSFLHWIGAFVFALTAHVILLGGLYQEPGILIERSSGPKVEIVGGGTFAEPEEEKESSIESQPSEENEAEGIAKEGTEDAEDKKPEPLKNINTIETTDKPKPKKKQKPKSNQTSNPKKRASKGTPSPKPGAGNRGKQKRVVGNAALTNYRGRVASHLAQYKRYPAEARRRNLYGKALVRFSISASGKVRSVRLARSSGSRLLDKAALSTVRRASPYPRVPRGMKVPVQFTAPIIYNIR